MHAIAESYLSISIGMHLSGMLARLGSFNTSEFLNTSEVLVRSEVEAVLNTSEVLLTSEVEEVLNTADVEALSVMSEEEAALVMAEGGTERFLNCMVLSLFLCGSISACWKAKRIN